jgi:1-acyl-sn-glycerol-3-phosphate acyltransferase
LANLIQEKRAPAQSEATEPRFRRLVKHVLRLYLRFWHGLEFQGAEHIPPTGPVLALVNHNSVLDVLALVAVDPFADSMGVAKASLFKIPPLRWLLAKWSAIPVQRAGRDTTAIRKIMSALRAGRVVAIAAEGTRSRTGRLLPINQVLARIAVRSGVPILPVGVIGSFDALPPGAIFPRRRKIIVRVGETFELPAGMSDEEAQKRIYDAIAALLPPSHLPEDSSSR